RKAADKVVVHSLLGQIAEKERADPVVHLPLARKMPLFLSVKGGGIILVHHPHHVRVLRPKQLFRLPLVQQFTPVHVFRLLSTGLAGPITRPTGPAGGTGCPRVSDGTGSRNSRRSPPA